MTSSRLSRMRHAISRTATIGIVVVIIIIIIAGSYAALTLSTTSKTATSSPTTGPSVTVGSSNSTSGGPQTINIGILEPLTGFASEYGITQTLAAQFAASQINSAGGVRGMQIRIFSADEGSGGSQTINAFNELVLQDHVNFIIGTDFSGDTETILPLITKYKVVTMSLSNSLDALHNLIGTGNTTSYNAYKYYFTRRRSTSLGKISSMLMKSGTEVRRKPKSGASQSRGKPTSRETNSTSAPKY
jgi:hypothetical protein